MIQPTRLLILRGVDINNKYYQYCIFDCIYAEIINNNINTPIYGDYKLVKDYLLKE